MKGTSAYGLELFREHYESVRSLGRVRWSEAVQHDTWATLHCREAGGRDCSKTRSARIKRLSPQLCEACGDQGAASERERTAKVTFQAWLSFAGLAPAQSGQGHLAVHPTNRHRAGLWGQRLSVAMVWALRAQWLLRLTQQACCGPCTGCGRLLQWSSCGYGTFRRMHGWTHRSWQASGTDTSEGLNSSGRGR